MLLERAGCWQEEGPWSGKGALPPGRCGSSMGNCRLLVCLFSFKGARVEDTESTLRRFLNEDLEGSFYSFLALSCSQ